MATRLYLANAAPTSSNVTQVRGGWDADARSTQYRLGPAPEGGSANLVGTAPGGNQEVLLGYFVSDGLPDDGVLEGTVEWCHLVDGNASDDGYALHIWVSQGDSNNLRGTLLSNYAGLEDWTSSNTAIQDGPQTLDPVTVVTGDRIVYEVGYTNYTSSDAGGQLFWGGTGADITAGSSSTSEAEWVEFSDPNGVLTPNDPPTADAGPDQTVIEGDTVNLDGTGSSDPNGDTLDYEWNVTDDGGTGLTDADIVDRLTATPSFTAPGVSTSSDVILTLTVTDPGGLSDTDPVTVTVNPETASGFGSGLSRSRGSATVSGGHLGSGAAASRSSGAAAVSGAHTGTGGGVSTSAGTAAVSATHGGSGAGRSVSRGFGSGFQRQFGAAGIARPVVGLSVRLINPDGTVGEYAPDFAKVEFTDIYNEPGTVAIDYAKGGIHADLLLADRAEGALFDGAIELPATRFLVTQRARDAIRETENTVQLNCPLLVPTRLDEARVYPASWPDTADPKHHFSASTPGAVIGILIQEAQGRGAITEIITNFSSSQTTDGQPWDKVVTLDLDAGGSVLAALQLLVEMGVCDWAAFGRELFLFNFGSGDDRTTGQDAVILQAGRDLLDAPEKRSVDELITVALVKGDEGAFVEVVDQAGVDAHGRLEGHTSVSGVQDTGTLTVVGEALLTRSSTPKREHTHELALFDPPGPQPWVDYVVGNRILRALAEGAGPEPFLVRQLSASYDQDGKVTGQITLGDKFHTADVALSRRIEALTNGSSGTVAPAPTPTEDDIAPLTPTGLLVNSEAYDAGQGTRAAVFAGWNEVTENEDGSAATDLAEYQVRWKPITQTSWRSAGSSTDTDLSWSPVRPSLSIEVQVRAVDRSGNPSPWSASVEHVTATDTIAPPTPGGITVENYLGQLKVIWDGTGLDSQGSVVGMPEDLKFARVHYSDSAGFAVSEANNIDYLAGAGTSVITNLEYGTTYFVKLVAVDFAGNESAPSAEFSGTPRGVGLQDITFKDKGNLVEDGSFEDAYLRKERTGGAFSFTQTNPKHGQWCMEVDCTVDAGTDRLRYLTPLIPVGDLAELYGRFAVRATDSDADGVIDPDGDIEFGVEKYDHNKMYYSAQWRFYNREFVSGTGWHQGGGVFDVDAEAVAFVRLFVRADSGNTLGKWFVDICEARERVGTLLVQDLAVTNAKIADLEAGKITSGIMLADVTVSGRIKTSDGAPRIELDDTGIRRYDANNNVVVEISENDVRVTGSLITETTTGSRIEIGAGSTRDTTIYYDVHGVPTLVFGQAYDASTGDPINNGILVQTDDEGEGGAGTNFDLLLVNATTESGSSVAKGLYMQLPDPDGVRMDFRTGHHNVVKATANDGGSGYAYMGPMSDGQGFYGQDVFGDTFFTLDRGFFEYNAQDVPGGNIFAEFSTDVQPVLGIKGGGAAEIDADATTIFGGALQDGSSGYFCGFVMDTDSDYHCRDGGQSVYTDIYAFSFQTASSQQFKRNIRPLEAGNLDAVRALPIKRWERDAGRSTTGQSSGLPRSGISPIVEEAPALIVGRRGTTIDLAASLFVLWAAVQELAEQVIAPSGGGARG